MQLKLFIKTISLSLLCTWPAIFTRSQQVEVVKLHLNTMASEVAPVIHDSVLYFISNRKSSVLLNVFNQHNEHLYNLYQAPLLKNGQFGKARISRFSNERVLSSGPVAFSPQGNFQVITRKKIGSTREARSSKTEIPLGLFQSPTLPGNRQAQHLAIPFTLNSPYSFGHPSISHDGDKLFFVSDKPGGYGKTDIYMSLKTAEGWSEPVNLGPGINTAGRELFPHKHASGKLYFSSDGHPGIGGLDIFFSVNQDGWNTPVQLTEPVNSVYDDFSCYIFPDEISGLFASNRDGTDNIYQFNYVIAECEDPAAVVEENYCFTFFEASAVALETPSLKYEWEFSDGHKAEGTEVDHCLPGPGLYQVSLNVIDAITGVKQYNVATYELLLEQPQQVYFQLQEKVRVNKPVVLQAKLTGFEHDQDIQFIWFLDDNQKQIGETISHVFRKKGKYQVKCKAYWGENQMMCSYRIVIVE